MLASPDVDAVLIATRHHQHAAMTAEALRAGKHVFVEKPLAIDEAGLATVVDAHAAAPQSQLMVGFNRRFSPLAAMLAHRMRGEQLIMTYRVNAGPIHDALGAGSAVGGGRIVGEVCHSSTSCSFLPAAPLSVRASAVGGAALRVIQTTS